MFSTKRAFDLVAVAETMETFGITSSLALEVFALVAMKDGGTLSEITGISSDDPDIKRYYGACRRLGSGGRGPGSGSELIEPGDERVEKNMKRYFLTEKGQRCAVALRIK